MAIHPQVACAEEDLILERGDKITQSKDYDLYFMRDQKTQRVLYCIRPHYAQPEPGHTLLPRGGVTEATGKGEQPGTGFNKDEKTNRRTAAQLDYIAYHGFFGDTTMQIGNVTGDANQLYLVTQLAINHALLREQGPEALLGDGAVTKDILDASEELYRQAVAYSHDVVDNGNHREEENTALWFVNSAETASSTWQTILTRGPRGVLRVKKESAYPELVKEGTEFSLSGARFGIYFDEACKKQVQKLTTGEDGCATSRELPSRDYWVKELTAPRGFSVSADVVKVHIAGGPQTAVVRDYPPVLPVGAIISKVDAETNSISPRVGPSLEGALFTASYYPRTGSSGAEPARSWTLRSDSEGKVCLDAVHMADENPQPLYQNAKGTVGLPCGTLVVTEVTPPEGYRLPDNPSWTFRIASGEDGRLSLYQEEGGKLSLLDGPKSVLEPAVRGDLEFSKAEEGSGKPMPHVLFRVTSKRTGESHIVKTDANGHFTSRRPAHSHATNRLDAAVQKDGTVDEDKLTNDCGVWFYGYVPQDGDKLEPANDACGAFPYGSYVFEELATSATMGHSLVTFEVEVGGDGSVVDAGTISDPTVTLATSARDGEDHDRYLSSSGKNTIEDTVSYTGLTPGAEYVLTCTLHDVATGKELTDQSGCAITGTAKFTPQEASGSQVVRVAIESIPANVTSVVAYERLTQNGHLIAAHEDQHDRDQTVYVPSLATTLTDKQDADHSIIADTRVTLDDTVKYQGLIPGDTYHIEGRLMDRETGKPLHDAQGNEIVSAVDLTPTSSDGEMHVSFDVDSSGLADHQIVAVETLSQNGITICSHNDLDDAKQTVSVVRKLVSLPNTGSSALASLVTAGALSTPLAAWGLFRFLHARKTE